jgi:hypothetical protein
MPGKLAGTPDSEGYQRIWLGRRGCRVGLRAHRIVWTMMTGEKPSMLIDHIDSNGMNNRWENLRQATHQENRNNRWSAGPRLSTGRFPYGVYYERQKYRAVIGLGSFDTVAEAHAAWKDAVRILRGSLACG